MTNRARRRATIPILAITAALLLGPAPSAQAGVTVPPVDNLGPTSFAVPGPYAVGQATGRLPRNHAPVEVWYPATAEAVAGKQEASYDMVTWLPDYLQRALPDGFAVTYPSGGVRGVDVAPGRFPLVVFSHGYAGFRTQSSFLTAWLASWGFVVAAPDHYSRDLTKVLGGHPASSTVATTDIGDLRATLTLMRAKDTRTTSRFHGHVNTRRTAAVGHSAGGAASEAWAAADKRVKAFVGLAGATVGAFGEEESGPRSRLPEVPGLIMAGSSDGVAEPGSLRKAYRKLHRPKRLIVVGGGHHAFSDLCEVGAADGGLLAIAEVLHVPVSDSLKRLASDGCDPPALPPTEAWPAIRQSTVAFLRHALGLDSSDAGLSGLRNAYPGVVELSRSAP